MPAPIGTEIVAALAEQRMRRLREPVVLARIPAGVDLLVAARVLRALGEAFPTCQARNVGDGVLALEVFLPLAADSGDGA